MADETEKYTVQFVAETAQYVRNMSRAAKSGSLLESATSRVAKAVKSAKGGWDNLSVAMGRAIDGDPEARLRRQANLMEEVRKSVDEGAHAFEGLANARYALYDVSAAMIGVRRATLDNVVALVQMGAQYETMFAQVRRTSGAIGAEWTELEAQLKRLSASIFSTAEEIAGVAKLGGQLGIDTDDLTNFTDSVLKFVSVTGLAAESTAESLGRIMQLSGTGADEYDNLTSAIYKLGVTSVATDQAILSVTEQIAVSGRQAGFSAQQTAALASALASLGVAPERARGSIQRVFNIITQSVDNTTEELGALARVTDMTTSEFASLWKNNSEAAFVALLQGMRNVEDQGGNMSNVLTDIGIGAVRDIDALKRLAQNTEVYTEAIANANLAYANGTEVQEAYSIIAETMEAQLQRLTESWNLFKTGLVDDGPFKVIIGSIQWLVDNLKKLADSAPVLKVIGTGIALLGAAVGIFAAIVSGAALFTASIFAMITAMGWLNAQLAQNGGIIFSMQTLNVQMFKFIQGLAPATAATYAQATALGRLSIAARVAGGSLLTALVPGLQATTRNASGSIKVIGGNIAALKGLKAVMYGVQVAARALWPLAAFWAANKVITAISGQLDNAKIAAEESKARVEEFTQALNLDTSNYEIDVAAGRSVELLSEKYNVLTREMEVATEAQSASEQASRALADGLLESVGETENMTEALREFTIAYGEALGNAQKESLGDILFGKEDEVSTEDINARAAALLEMMDRLGLSQEEFYAKLQDTEGMEDFKNELYAVYSAMNSGEDRFKGSGEVLSALNDVMSDTVTATDDLFAAQAKADAEIATGTAEVDGLGDAADETADDIVDLAGALKALAETMNADFSFRDAFDDLYAGLQEGTLSLDTFTEAGRAGYEQVAKTIETGYANMGDSPAFAAMLQQLYDNLQAAGLLNSEVERLFQTAWGWTDATASSSDMQAANFEAQAARARAMIEAYEAEESAATKSANSAKKAAAATKKAVRTVQDYVSDLSSVMSQAFEIRFGFEVSEDNTQGIINKQAERFRDAEQAVRDYKLQIRELHDEQKSLTADRKILEYQLGVAKLYGDSLRAAQIEAELAKNRTESVKVNNDLADTQEELANAQLEASRTTSGNSDAAIENRAALRDLTEAMQEQITAYANSGATQEQVTRYAEQLRRKFVDQATQLGYNKTDVEKYAKSLDDAITIVKSVPRNVTTDYNLRTNPALAALKNFWAKQEVKDLTSNKSTDLTVNGKFKPDRSIDKLQEFLRLQRLYSQWQKLWNNGKGPGYALNNMEAYASSLEKFQFADGGWTGPGGKYDAAGIVHRDEFVFTKEATSGNVPFLNALMQSLERGGSGGSSAPVSSAASGNMVLELGPTSMRAVREGGTVNINIGGNEVTGAVNSRNAATTVRKGVV